MKGKKSMTTDTSTLTENVKMLFNEEKFEEVIAELADEVLKGIKEKDKAAELYVWRGQAWYNKHDYDKAIIDYSTAIKNKQKYALAFYNRGLARGVKKEDYSKAIKDYNRVIKINPSYIDAYVSRGSIFRFKKKYDIAIKDFDKAITIDTNDASAYFHRGLTKKENNVDLEGARQDFEKYIELTADGKDTWAKYANSYIEYITERINDKELSVIADLIANIKNILIFKEDCITHYTSLTALKSLILDISKFRISEGNFLNDPSEGKMFFNFLNYEPVTFSKDIFLSERFTPKPFIGSFVTESKCNDLNMWRFYGKEKDIEAKGCAITLLTKKFIEAIINAIPKDEEDYLRYESDINFIVLFI